jgi:hypothetical protein
MASENQFTVDLGTMKLSAEDRAQINGAIQKAVAGEVSRLNIASRIVLIPISTKFPGGVITNGIIARPIDEKIFKELIR